MKHQKITIPNAEGAKKELLFDSELIDGLWLCVDQDKVESNAAQMGINLNRPEEDQNVSTHIDKFPKHCIITMLFDEGHHLQYLCLLNLKLEALDRLKPNQLPPDIRAIIREALGAPQKIRLGDLFKK